jgi:hypothetical protein
MNVSRWIVTGLIVLAAALLWRPHVTTAPIDPSERLEARASVPPPVLATLRRACFDCHSRETRWPWYARVAPASWLVAHDVTGGRRQIDFSSWSRYNPYDRADMLDKMCDMTMKGRMPMWQYRLIHREARLTPREVTALCAWTDAEAARLVQGGP